MMTCRPAAFDKMIHGVQLYSTQLGSRSMDQSTRSIPSSSEYAKRVELKDGLNRKQITPKNM